MNTLKEIAKKLKETAAPKSSILNVINSTLTKRAVVKIPKSAHPYYSTQVFVSKVGAGDISNFIKAATVEGWVLDSRFKYKAAGSLQYVVSMVRTEEEYDEDSTGTGNDANGYEQLMFSTEARAVFLG